MENIKFIRTEDTYNIRCKVLRNRLDIESAKFPNDFSPGTFHLGYFLDDEITGVISCIEAKFNEDENNAFQIRGMAVLDEYRGRSIGKSLCIAVEEIIKAFGVSILWFNARNSVVEFYEKLGFQKEGNSFNIKGIGEHYLMYKNIN